MYGLDLARAYRQLRIDPGDWELMGVNWKGLWYLDKTPAFGVRLGAHFCCRVTNAVCSIARRWGNPMFAYIDDFIDLEGSLSLATIAFNRNRAVLATLGHDESKHKATAPSTVVTWVGVTFNSVDMTMAIPREKIREILTEVTAWASEATIQLCELQKLLGRIFHVTKCCVGAPLFCNRLLDGLRVAYRQGHTPITREMHMDLFWLFTFLERFNGVHLIRDPKGDRDIICGFVPDGRRWHLGTSNVHGCLYNGGRAVWLAYITVGSFQSAPVSQVLAGLLTE